MKGIAMLRALQGLKSGAGPVNLCRSRLLFDTRRDSFIAAEKGGFDGLLVADRL